MLLDAILRSQKKHVRMAFGRNSSVSIRCSAFYATDNVPYFPVTDIHLFDYLLEIPSTGVNMHHRFRRKGNSALNTKSSAPGDAIDAIDRRKPLRVTELDVLSRAAISFRASTCCFCHASVLMLMSSALTPLASLSTYSLMFVGLLWIMRLTLCTFAPT